MLVHPLPSAEVEGRCEVRKHILRLARGEVEGSGAAQQATKRYLASLYLVCELNWEVKG